MPVAHHCLLTTILPTTFSTAVNTNYIPDLSARRLVSVTTLASQRSAKSKTPTSKSKNGGAKRKEVQDSETAWPMKQKRQSTPAAQMTRQSTPKRTTRKAKPLPLATPNPKEKKFHGGACEEDESDQEGTRNAESGSQASEEIRSSRSTCTEKEDGRMDRLLLPSSGRTRVCPLYRLRASPTPCLHRVSSIEVQWPAHSH